MNLDLKHRFRFSASAFLVAFLSLGATETRTDRNPSRAMEPTYPLGGIVAWHPIEGEAGARIQRGDVVVFKDPSGETFNFKRVVALAGDTVAIRKFQIYVNAQPVEATYGRFHSEKSLGAEDVAATKVPEGHVYVMGDNWALSRDSRRFGPVAVSSIVGPVEEPR